jgi:hypothetical protein
MDSCHIIESITKLEMMTKKLMKEINVTIQESSEENMFHGQ